MGNTQPLGKRIYLSATGWMMRIGIGPFIKRALGARFVGRVRDLFDRYDVYRFRRNKNIPPIPPATLRFSVAGTEGIEWFHESGAASAKMINDALLHTVGRDVATFEHIFDFGCGCSRILRWFANYPSTCHFYGTDIYEEAIHWSEKNIPYAKFYVNGYLPPLPFEEDKFDLIYANSVFTHLDENYQDQWLAELKRVSMDGAILILTVHGKHAWEKFYETDPANPAMKNYKDALDSEGMLFVSDDSWTGIFPDFYHTAFHKKSYVMDHWGSYFEILDYIERGVLDYQDAVVVRNNE